MTTLVHLTPEKNGARILRSGIAAGSTGRLGDRGSYCMPVLASYELTYQWTRELRRSGQRTLVAVHFRIPDDEPVTVGRYSAEPTRMSAARAAGLIGALADPRGYEIFVPRPVTAAEIHRVREIPRVVGWRYFPNAHGRRPCGCPACLRRGEYKASDIRARCYPADAPRRPRPELLADLRAATTSEGIIESLWALGGRRRADAHELAFLIDHPDAEVRTVLADQLRNYRGRTARDLLEKLRLDPDPDVREAAEPPSPD